MIETAQTLEGNISVNELISGELNKEIEYVEPTTQEKTITPTKETQIVLPDENIFALSKVTVNPIGDEYVIPAGTINITSNNIYDVTNYASANVNINLNMWADCGYSDTPQPILDIHNYTRDAYQNWDSSSTKFNNYFSTTYKDITIVPMIDTSNITTFTGAFNGCANIVDFPLLNTSNATGFSNVFYNCTNLQNVPVLDTSKADNFSGFFNNCKKLSETTLNNILQMCINATAYKGTKTLYYLGLRSANYPVATIQALPKYQDFINAGWTIGY